MDMATYISQMVGTIQAIGMKMSSTDMVGKIGPTKANMKAVTDTASRKVRVIFSGMMVLDIREDGAKIKCMGRVFSPGPTAKSTKAAISTAKNKDLESLVGRMAVNMKAIFRIVSSMGKVSLRRRIRINILSFGIMAKKLR